uniref:Uncharacterized protein n=1 Tax=Glossina austeni TaxID=7395 RepID=A0A1A9V4N7_GLOAU
MQGDDKFLKTTSRSSLSAREFNNYVYKTTIIILLKTLTEHCESVPLSRIIISIIIIIIVGHIETGIVLPIPRKVTHAMRYNLYLIKDISTVKAVVVIERDGNGGLRSWSKENIYFADSFVAATKY